LKRPYHKETWQHLASEMLNNKETTKSEFESAYIALRLDDPDLAKQLLKASKIAPDWRKLSGIKSLRDLYP
jgi:hypothetical protein